MGLNFIDGSLIHYNATHMKPCSLLSTHTYTSPYNPSAADFTALLIILIILTILPFLSVPSVPSTPYGLYGHS